MNTRIRLFLLLLVTALLSCNGSTVFTTSDAGIVVQVMNEAGVDVEVTIPFPVPVSTTPLSKVSREEAKAFAKAHPSPVIPRTEQVRSLRTYATSAYTVRAASSPTSAIYPVAWSVTAWWVDDENVTGLASDFNDCQTSVTPCATIQEIVVHRWGTSNPQIQNPVGTFGSTTITMLSPSPNSTADSPDINPSGGFVDITGTLVARNTQCTGTLASVISKNPATRQLLNANLCKIGGVTNLTPPILIFNSTKPSYAWINALTDSENAGWNLSQPLDSNTGNETNTWANGDSFTAYKLDNFQFRNIGIVAEVDFLDTTGQNDDCVFTGVLYTSVNGIDACWIPPNGFTLGLTNDDMPDNSYGLPDGTNIKAGQYRGGNNLQGQFVFSNDFVASGIQVITRGTTIVNGTGIWLIGAVLKIQNGTFLAGNSGLGYITGTGNIRVGFNSTLRYNTGAAQAAATFLTTGTIFIDNSTTACSISGTAPATENCGITVNATNLDAVAGVSGFGGRAFLNGGASVVNVNVL